MAEPIQQFLLVLNILDKLRNIRLLADLFQHPQNSLIGPTMFRPIQRPSGPSNRRIDIDAGR